MTTLHDRLYPELSAEEMNRRAPLFRTLNLCQIIATGALMVIGGLDSLDSTASILLVIIPCLTLIGVLIFAGRQVRAGRYYAGVFLSIAAITAILCFFLCFYGTQDTVAFIFVWPIIVAAVLLEPIMSYLAAVIMAVLLALLTLTELFQWLPLPVHSGDFLYATHWHLDTRADVIVGLVTDWMVIAVVYFVTAFAFYLVSSSLRRAIDNSRRMITELDAWADDNVELATRINNAATEIEATIHQQKMGASQQAVAVETIAGSVRALLDGARKIAERSSVVAENAGKSLEHNDKIVERIKTLADQTRRITEILHVMKRIANKSDLLALNAALEGVKAGTRGRGFVLVASEVRRLAEDVLSSVRDIRDLTEDIGEATSAVKGSSLDGAKLAERTAELTQEISLITRQQEEGTELLDEAIQNIAEIAVQTAGATGQVADSTRTLGSLAENIRELASQREKFAEVRTAAGESAP